MLEWQWINGINLGFELVVANKEHGIEADTWIIDLLFIRIIEQSTVTQKYDAN